MGVKGWATFPLRHFTLDQLVYVARKAMVSNLLCSFVYVCTLMYRNPIENYPDYRAAVLAILPYLRSLDFAKGQEVK
jgi:hypothetical protein